MTKWDIHVPIGIAHGLFVRLTTVRYRRRVEIGDGTDMVLMEKNRRRAFDIAVGFLDEGIEPAC